MKAVQETYDQNIDYGEGDARKVRIKKDNRRLVRKALCRLFSESDSRDEMSINLEASRAGMKQFPPIEEVIKKNAQDFSKYCEGLRHPEFNPYWVETRQKRIIKLEKELLRKRDPAILEELNRLNAEEPNKVFAGMKTLAEKLDFQWREVEEDWQLLQEHSRLKPTSDNGAAIKSEKDLNGASEELKKFRTYWNSRGVYNLEGSLEYQALCVKFDRLEEKHDELESKVIRVKNIESLPIFSGKVRELPQYQVKPGEQIIS